MAREIVTKGGRFYCVSLIPDICKTPIGNSTPPIPYTIKGEFAEAEAVSPNISSHSEKVVLHDRSTIPTVTGDSPGSANGVKSGTVGKRVQTKEKSGTFRFNGAYAVREGDVVRMNDDNTQGQVYERGGEAAQPRIDADNSASPAETPAEPKPASLWDKASPWVHGTLGLASFVPGLSVVTGGIDAAIYAGEGNLVEAGLSAAAMIPGGKLVTTAGKVVKGAAGMVKGARAAEEAAKLAKIAKAAKEAEEAAKAARLAKEVKLAKEAEEAGLAAKAKGKDGGKSKGKGKKKGPCDHLKKGNGKGDYRGGSHSETSKPANDGKDSHHMPADDVSPIPRKDGTAIQMEPDDHKGTSSNGSSRDAVQYRQLIERLLKDGKWRDAMAMEIKDVREIAREAGDQKKYNQAIKEMLEYFKCLEKHGLLPKE